MGFFDFFRKKRVENEKNILQEDRELGAMITADRHRLKRERLQLEHEIEMLKLQQQKQELLLDLEEYVDHDDGMDPDQMIKDMLMKAFINKAQPSKPQNADLYDTENLIPQQVAVSDSHFEEIWSRIPADQKPLIRMASEDQIRNFIRKNYPAFDEQTINRAILFVKRKI